MESDFLSFIQSKIDDYYYFNSLTSQQVEGISEDQKYYLLSLLDACRIPDELYNYYQSEISELCLNDFKVVLEELKALQPIPCPRKQIEQVWAANGAFWGKPLTI